jgi:hypothetical protein
VQSEYSFGYGHGRRDCADQERGGVCDGFGRAGVGEACEQIELEVEAFGHGLDDELNVG